MLTQLIYISAPVPEYSAEINSALEQKQLKNKSRGINGMMLSHTNFYLQIIEGDRKVVNSLYHEIVCDIRHTDITLVRYQDINRLQFNDWLYAVLDKNLDAGFYQHINDLIDIDSDFIHTLTSTAAMCILRRAAVIVSVKLNQSLQGLTIKL